MNIEHGREAEGKANQRYVEKGQGIENRSREMEIRVEKIRNKRQEYDRQFVRTFATIR